MDKTDRYSEYDICEICRKCKKFSVNCSGKNVAIYADSSESCWNFEKLKIQCKKRRKK